MNYHMSKMHRLGVASSMEKNKQVEITQFNEQDCILGQTNLGIWYGPPSRIWRELYIDSPFTYRSGIATLLSYLKWFSFCGQNGYLDDHPENIDYKYINETAEKIITIFTTERIESANLESLSWGLVAFKMLGRLDEVNLSAIVDHIKDKQFPDGGFESPLYSFLPDLQGTLYAVQALLAVNESPRNLSAIKGFVDSLQVGEYPGGSSYDFKLLDNEKYGVPSEGVSHRWTLIAGTILRTLHFPLNNSDKLLLKLEKVYADHMANHSTLSLDYQVESLYGIMKWTSIFPGRGDEIRVSLQPLAFDLLRTLPNDSKWKRIPIGAGLYENRFPLLLARQNRSNPRLNCSISPGRFFKSNSSQHFTLRIANPGPLWYDFSSKSLSVLGEHQGLLSIKDFSPGNYQLSQKEQVDIPFTIEKLPSSTNFSASNFTLELTLNVPVVGSKEYKNEYEFFDCKLNFTLALLDDPSEEEQKGKIDPLVLAGLIGIPVLTVGAGGVIGATLAMKKRKKQKEIL